MSEIKRIGIDTSKAVFTLHAIDQADRPVLRVNLRRAQMLGLGAQIAGRGFGETRDGSIGLVSPPVWMTDALQGQ
jgi:hypothetical protein